MSFTKAGVKALLRSAFWRSGGIWRVGLCANLPGENVSLSDILEPDATNGYARVQLPLNNANWPVIDELVGQVYIRSKLILFDLTGPISIPVNRMFLTDGAEVISISTPLEGAEDGLIVPDAPFSTNYRFFLR